MKENSKLPLKQIQNLTIRWNSNIDCDIYRIINAFPLNITATQKFPQNSYSPHGNSSPFPYPSHTHTHGNSHTHGRPGGKGEGEASWLGGWTPQTMVNIAQWKFLKKYTGHVCSLAVWRNVVEFARPWLLGLLLVSVYACPLFVCYRPIHVLSHRRGSSVNMGARHFCLKITMIN